MSQLRVLVKAPFDISSGYGNDGIGLARALSALGVDVRLHPFGISPPLPRDVAMLLTKPLEPPFDVAFVHLDPLALEASTARKVTRRMVAWTMWEWDSIKVRGAYRIRKRLQDFDLVLAYDHVSAEALSKHVPKSVQMQVLQGGYWAEDWPYMERDWTSDPFRFVSVVTNSRKDPFVTIRAFDRLKQEHGSDFKAELHIKLINRLIHPKAQERYPGLRLYYAYWDMDQMHRFYVRGHCLISSSRGEGKNMPALEAQSTGMPVIVTDFGGHKMWLSSEFAYPLRCDIVEDEMGRSARASEDHLAELMWHVYTNRHEAREKGRVAARTIPGMCDWTNVARRALERAMETEGRQLWDQLG